MLRELTETLLRELELIARRRDPVEAVGLILPDGVVLELPNRSLSGQDSFLLVPDDIQLSLEVAHIDGADIDWAKVTLWHSHPGGGVGPSKIDMKHKLPKLSHLVMTLTETEAIPTWY